MDYFIYFSPLLLVIVALFLRMKVIYYLSIVYLILFVGLRGAGGDIYGYTLYYETSNALNNVINSGFATDKSTIKYSIEFFYSFINSLSKSISGGLELVFFISALAFILTSYFASKNFNKKRSFLFFSFFIITSLAPLGMHYVRQGLAVAFIALAISNCYSYKKKLLAIIFSVGSHLTTSVAGIMFIYILSMKKRNITILIIIPIIGLLLGDVILSQATTLIQKMNSTIFNRYIVLFENSRGISTLDKMLGILAMAHFFYLSIVVRCTTKNELMDRRFMATALIYFMFIVLSLQTDIASRYFTLVYPFLLYFSYETLVINIKQKNIVLVVHLFLAILIWFRFISDPGTQELFFPFKLFL
jgi:hypothetical protein